MLTLTGIQKTYIAGTSTVDALCGVSLSFRKNEFVAILGPSGCGKTTLLNIIGGLDRYTAGDLKVNGRSTKHFKDRDWDTYRNHSIGFVFQSYNLIPHQTVLKNVELALTLSGVSRAERRKRATEALEKVGLGDQLHKKPNQMSGGQMQRVAIARALVNDPEILLADEPTGALDSATSVQIMEILKEISGEKLIIMVTHNPELAAQYATRTVRLLDGEVTDDTNPYTEEPACEVPTDKKVKKAKKKKEKHTSMSFFTALSLSLNNLMTKKARTFLTSFAGSIGIIGIALILALSQGVQTYIDTVQEDTLSTYPLTIESATMNMSEMFTANDEEMQNKHDLDAVYSNSNMTHMLNSMMQGMVENDLNALREYFEDPDINLEQYISDVKYAYDLDIALYNTAGDLPVKVDAMEIIDEMYESMMGMSYSDMVSGMGSMGNMASSMMGINIMSELLDNQELLDSQYELVDEGKWPTAYNEMVLVVNENNELMDMALYALGIRDRSEIPSLIEKVKNGEEVPVEQLTYSYDELLNTSFHLAIAADKYADTDGDGVFEDLSLGVDSISDLSENGIEMKICGIVRPKEGAVASSISGVIGYSPKLAEYIIDYTEKTDVVKAQRADNETDVLTGMPFAETITRDEVKNYLLSMNPATLQMLPAEYAKVLGSLMPNPDLVDNMSASEVHTFFAPLLRPGQSTSTYESNLSLMGVADREKPVSISIYPKDFASKEEIVSLIDNFNEGREEEEQIVYTDYIGLMMSSITTIINAISYILIAFVAISLVVSSIMIGIITYISVLERTKEIGILRSIGASKKDISRVFNAETLIVGFTAGAIGIGVTLLLCIPINIIIRTLTRIVNIGAVLPWKAAIALVLISMVLTLVAGLFPARVAAKKDPVVALRTE